MTVHITLWHDGFITTGCESVIIPSRDAGKVASIQPNPLIIPWNPYSIPSKPFEIPWNPIKIPLTSHWIPLKSHEITWNYMKSLFVDGWFYLFQPLFRPGKSWPRIPGRCRGPPGGPWLAPWLAAPVVTRQRGSPLWRVGNTKENLGGSINAVPQVDVSKMMTGGTPIWGNPHMVPWKYQFPKRSQLDNI